MENDRELMVSIRGDDYVSYNKLFTRYYVPLCRYVHGILMNKNDAEDVVSELFLILWKNRVKIDIRNNVSCYLYRMAYHLALNTLRSGIRPDALPDNIDQLQLAYEDNHVEQDELRMALYECIDRLPRRNREVFLLHRIKQQKKKEIAEQLSISVKTIKNQIWISLRKLRDCLEEKGV